MKSQEQLKQTYQSAIREQAGVALDDTEQVVKQQQQEHENEIKRTIKIQWIQDSVTQQFLKDLNKDIAANETRARDLAFTYHTHNNHLEIVNLLVRATELRIAVCASCLLRS